MILTYRKKGEMNFGKLDEPGLKEEEFVNSKTQPWIEQITLKFDGAKTDSAGDLVATGTLKATYNANKAALSDISINIVGGSTKLGLTDKGKGFKVHRIEGVGYNDVIPADPEGKSWPKRNIQRVSTPVCTMPYFSKGSRQYMPVHWILDHIHAYMLIGQICTQSARSTIIRWREEQKSTSPTIRQRSQLYAVPG